MCLFRAANVWWRCAQYLLLPLVARCLEAKDVCIWPMFAFMAVVVLKIVGFSLGVLKYVCVRDVMDVVFYVCEA